MKTSLKFFAVAPSLARHAVRYPEAVADLIIKAARLILFACFVDDRSTTSTEY